MKLNEIFYEHDFINARMSLAAFIKKLQEIDDRFDTNNVFIEIMDENDWDGFETHFSTNLKLQSSTE